VPIEDRIDQLSRLVLVILLLVTLGWVGQGRAQNALPEAAADEDAPPLILVAKGRTGEALRAPRKYDLARS